MRSPEEDSIVASYMRAMAEIAGRRAELRVKAWVSQESLEAARSYMHLTEEAAERVEATSGASLSFRVESAITPWPAKLLSRRRRKLPSLAFSLLARQIAQQIRERLDEVERSFGEGRSLRRSPE